MSGIRLRFLGRAANAAVGHAAPALLAVATPLLAIPVIVRTVGPTGWASVAVGQSMGALCAIAISMGWAVQGADTIARSPVNQRSVEYHRSLGPQIMTASVVVPLAAFTAAAIAPGSGLVSALTVVAFAMQGFSAAWFFTGVGRPWMTVLNEAFPRLVATLASSAALVLGVPLEVYPYALILAGALGAWLNAAAVRRRYGMQPILRPGETVSTLRRELGALAARLTITGYFTGAVSVVSAVAPSAAVVFAAADRVQKSWINALLFLPHALVPFVAGGVEKRSRRSRVLAVDLTYAVCGGLVTLVSWPLLTKVLFGDSLVFEESIGLLSAAIVSVALAQRSIGLHWLVAAQLAARYYVIGATTSIVGLVALAVVAALTSSAAAALAVLLAVELALLLAFLLAGAIIRTGTPATSR